MGTLFAQGNYCEANGEVTNGVLNMIARKLNRVARAVVVAGCLWAGCTRQPAAEVALPKPPEVSVSQAVERTVTDYEEFTGRMDAAETVEIRARVSGYLNEVSFSDGQEVKAGAVLFQIDPRTFEADVKNTEGQKAQWLAKRDRAKADVTRYEGLVPSGAASAQDLDQARAELGEAIAAIQSADAAIERAKLNLEFSRITAPIDGQVGEALITKGNLIQSGAGDQVLTTIVSLDPIYVYFDVDERTLLRFRERHPPDAGRGNALPSVAELKIPVQLGLATDEGFPRGGVIDFADNRVNPATGTVRVRGAFDNAKREFKPGLFARVRIPVSEPYPALLVAETALGTDQGRKFVLVVNAENIVERRFVKPGPPQGDGLRVISDGLKSGDWVVVNGLQRARPGKPVTPQRIEMPMIVVGGGAPPAASDSAKGAGR